MLDFGVEGILVVENDMIRVTLAITGIDIVFSFAPDTDAYEYIRVVESFDESSCRPYSARN